MHACLHQGKLGQATWGFELQTVQSLNSVGALGGLGALDVVQEVGSIGFAVLYMLGVRKIRRERQTRTQHKRLSLLDESSAIESRTWSVSALDHPANVVTQVVLASLVPTAGDVLSFGLGSDISLYLSRACLRPHFCIS